MSFPLVTLPDAEALVCGLLADETGTGGELEGAVVGTELPTNLRDNLPVIRVRRFGGVPTWKHRFDAPRLDIEAWSEDKATAHDLAQKTRASIVANEGVQQPRGYLGKVADEQGMQWLPDEVTGLPRYLFTIQLVIVANT